MSAKVYKGHPEAKPGEVLLCFIGYTPLALEGYGWDSKRTGEIKEVLLDMNRRRGVTIILVTHNLELAKAASRVVELRDGRIV